ncbi:MAG: NAD(P)/FAD-dependent oxidoreductase [Chloroflexi bacterium]|nr:MAG: NAD(P)/FAD-dependent oxidoreductase [Chloroflexota bacterium]
MSKKIVIIGGGPAGIEAAKAAKNAGADVTLVSNAPVGGRAGWHSLLPSKVWLTVAETLGVFHEADALGVSHPPIVEPAPADVLVRLQQVKSDWHAQQQQTLHDLDVEILTGTAVFTTPNTIELRDKAGNATSDLQADAFIITTGSVPIFPPDMKPNGKGVIAPRFASALKKLPQSVIVVGGGATGSEFAYLFCGLGLEVTWIVEEKGVLPDFDPAAGQFLSDSMKKYGVKLVQGQRAVAIDDMRDFVNVTLADGSKRRAEMAFLAIGRKPDVGNLNLEAAGLTVENGTVAVDEYGRSANPNIYLAGDVTGSPMIANRAMAQAWVAGKHAAGDCAVPYESETVVSAIYTEPQVAQIGDLSGKTVQVSYAESMKGHLLRADGFVKVGYDEGNGRITGAVAVGPHAADVLAPVMVAIQANLTIQEFGNLYGAHPTMSELPFIAARQV